MSSDALHSPAPLLSAQWFRTAGLRPRLDPHAVIERSVVRGEVWHVLVRADGTRSFRLNGAAWSAVARCDGQLTVQRLWDIALLSLGDAAPTQDEWLDILARLHAAGLLSFDRQPDFGTAGPPDPAAQRAADAARDPQRRNSLLAWRFPIGQPDALLARWAPRLRGLFTPAALAAWIVLLLAALASAWPRAEELSAWVRSGMGTPRLLWIAALIYPVVKLLHELAHGLAARRFGARVPEWGISLLMFLPVPYVDASAASALPDARHRVVVAGAGIAVELALAALVVLLALQVQPGLLRDIALVVFFLCALSTLLVNANPLLRFDGYHLLCDAAALPNLATRSTRHWLQVLRRRLLRSDAEATLHAAPGEARWLWLYAPLALLMRWVVACSVVAWLGSLSFLLGAAAALLMGAPMVGKPLWALWRWWRSGALGERERGPAARRMSAAALVIALPLVALPWPDATVAQGVLWLPEHALVRARAEGRIEEVLVSDGQAVQAGDALIVLRAPDLQARAEALQGRIDALRSEQAASLRDEPARAVAAEHALQAAEAELADVTQRLDQLVVRAQVAGTVAITRAQDLPGRHVPRGTLLAHVITGEPGVAQVAIPHDRAAWVAAHQGTVELRRADASAATLRGRWSGTTSGAGAQLPHAALGDRHGGRIPVDPAEPEGLKPASAVVLGEVQLDGPSLPRLGERVLVRFEHGHLPLAAQALRWTQQQVLRHFNPAQ